MKLQYCSFILFLISQCVCSEELVQYGQIYYYTDPMELLLADDMEQAVVPTEELAKISSVIFRQDLKKECQACVELGMIFGPNGCQDSCQNLDGFSLIQDQISGTVVVKRKEQACIERKEDCMEMEQLPTCSRCLQFGGAWVTEIGCRQNCSADTNECFDTECPEYSQTQYNVCKEKGGVLCQDFSSCTSECSECYCSICQHLKGFC
eukprot:TRINITY_DN1395_c1_g1_i11.p3 TRINITY_DN1395_c1_g1~~TRINITY_DN1395_c1_g1_i11.p3  ORF type:complete len:207 (-),score=13.48 TRINITY_DN1395_c1_g1_i11:528-1148(-)